MSVDVREKSRTIEVPANVGVDGFMHAVREVIRLPRVQKIVIDKAGRVTFTQIVRPEEEESNLNVSFDHLQPYHIIRNARTQELSYPASLNASAVVGAMLDTVTSSGLTPIAFVASPNTGLWSWLYFGDDLNLSSRDTFFGYPLYTDRQIPDTALVLCAGVDGTTALVDTKLSVKVEMQRAQILDEEVDVT